MTREELIETMARAIYAQKGFVLTETERMLEPAKWEDADDDDYQCIRDGYRQEAAAALAAIEAAGLCIVPVYPTASMLDAALEADTWSPIEIWEAMVTAGRI